MHRFAATFAIVAILITAGMGNAQPNSQPDKSPAAASEVDDYTALLLRGQERSAAGDWPGALADYRRAFEMANGEVDWIPAGSHANAALQVGSYVEAATMFRYAMKRLLPSDDRYQEYQQKMADRIAQAKANVGEVTLTVTPTSARVVVDGKPLAASQLADSMFLEPGSRAVAAQLEGYEAQTITVEVGPGEKTTVALTLLPAATSTPSSPEEAGIDAGLYGGGIALVGLGVVGLVAATVLGVTSQDRQAAADELSAKAAALAPAGDPCGNGSPIRGGELCASIADEHGARTDYRNAAVATGVAGGVLLAGGVAMLVAGASGGDEPSVGVAVTPSFAGISLSGIF